ncbi:MAG: hypothetical protein Q9216_005474 [Gyalolechia sp. 2 TL-2023]
MAEASSLLSLPDPSKRRSTVSEWSEGPDAHDSWNRNHDDEFSLKLLRPWSIASHNSVRSRTSTLTGTQYAASSAVEADDASTKGLLSSATWTKFARRSRDRSEDPDSPGVKLAYGGPGWWKHQMLADRSFRTMAALTTVFAFIMIIICLVYFPDLVKRANKHSTSVGGKADQTCSSMEGKNVFIHLLINVAATMILGMSNTYQQLITSLSTSELRWALSKHEDSRVGTNSPFNINHKKSKKVQSWCEWILLVATSLPVHFLANSVIGPTVYYQPPTNVTSYLVEELSRDQKSSYESDLEYGLKDYESVGDRACWLAFRTGVYSITQSSFDTGSDIMGELEEWIKDAISINYTEPCEPYLNRATLEELRDKEFNTDLSVLNATLYGIGDCGYGRDIACDLHAYRSYREEDEGVGEKMCRLSVRMSAAIILAGCLTIKAVYMITIMLRARQKIKTQCLTFGDVIAASALDSSLQVHNECLVNAYEGHRHLVQHTCHPKHCRPGAAPSESGDSIGHCQKCKKFNETNRAADLVHPSIAIKYKKSLLANLGGNAMTQMGILMISSCAMFGISLMLAVSVGTSAKEFRYQCSPRISDSWVKECERGLAHYLKYKFGYFGSFDTAAALGNLEMDSLNSELAAFAISNGAQLLYSVLYILLIYNFTLITMEHDWGKLETVRAPLRCTLVQGEGFKQTYLLQLPKRVLYPMMGFSALMHWLLGQSISTKETIWFDGADGANRFESSRYDVVYGAYAIWVSTVLMLMQTGICWWAFSYSREGFMPQMYGSIRACCAATTELKSFPKEGIQWGDLGEGEKFRHAGFSSGEVGDIVPAELYCGRGSGVEVSSEKEKTFDASGDTIRCVKKRIPRIDSS